MSRARKGIMPHFWLGRYALVWIGDHPGFESVWPFGIVGPYADRADFYKTLATRSRCHQ